MHLTLKFIIASHGVNEVFNPFLTRKREVSPLVVRREESGSTFART